MTVFIIKKKCYYQMGFLPLNPKILFFPGSMNNAG